MANDSRTALTAAVNRREQQTLTRLSHLLSLPKAFRWLCCEWFYSDIDSRRRTSRAIFDSENDFELCLSQSFPRLKSRTLKRNEWCVIRRLIGKPRRCSDAFFVEERRILDDKRRKIRLVQQRQFTLNNNCSIEELLKELPHEIPLTLSIGQRVLAHVSRPLDDQGVYAGTIAAIDLVEHSYRVVFDRHSLGSRSFNDIDVLSVPARTMPLRAYIHTYRPPAPLPPPSSSTRPTTTSAFPGGVGVTGAHGMLLTPVPGGKWSDMLLAATASVDLLATPGGQAGGVSSSASQMFSTLLLDDLHTLNAASPMFAAALIMQASHGGDPMLGICSPSLSVARHHSASTGGDQHHSTSSSSSTNLVDLVNSQFRTPMLNTTSGGIITNITTATATNAPRPQPHAPPLLAAAETSNSQTSTAVGDGGAAAAAAGDASQLHLLLMITRLNKILKVKRDNVAKLAEMNAEAERVRASTATTTTTLSRQFQMTYAMLLLDLERLNKDLSEYLSAVKCYCADIAADTLPSLSTVAAAAEPLSESIGADATRADAIAFCGPREAREHYERQARDLFDHMRAQRTTGLTNKSSRTRSAKKEAKQQERAHQFAVQLASLLIQLKDLAVSSTTGCIKSENSSSSSSLNVECIVNESVDHIKRTLSSPRVARLFEDKVHLHIGHIQSRLCPHNRLHAFSYKSAASSNNSTEERNVSREEDWQQPNAATNVSSGVVKQEKIVDERDDSNESNAQNDTMDETLVDESNSNNNNANNNRRRKRDDRSKRMTKSNRRKENEGGGGGEEDELYSDETGGQMYSLTLDTNSSAHSSSASTSPASTSGKPASPSAHLRKNIVMSNAS